MLAADAAVLQVSSRVVHHETGHSRALGRSVHEWAAVMRASGAVPRNASAWRPRYRFSKRRGTGSRWSGVLVGIVPDSEQAVEFAAASRGIRLGIRDVRWGAEQGGEFLPGPCARTCIGAPGAR